MQMVPFEAAAEDQGGSSQQSPTQQGERGDLRHEQPVAQHPPQPRGDQAATMDLSGEQAAQAPSERRAPSRSGSRRAPRGTRDRLRGSRVVEGDGDHARRRQRCGELDHAIHALYAIHRTESRGCTQLRHTDGAPYKPQLLRQ